jgi:hypothetical protein
MLVKPPENFLFKNTIIDDNVYKNYEIDIDNCLVKEVQNLWKQGIRTKGCCCGHSKNVGFIQIEEIDIPQMLNLGYEWYTDYPKEFGGTDRKDAFIPKSECHCNDTQKLVTFINSQNQEREIGKAITQKEAYEIINKFLEDHNFKSYYTRVNMHEQYLFIDVGSHSEFFKIYDNGLWR